VDNRNVDFDQVRSLLRLMGELTELPTLPERKHHFVVGLGRILHSPEVALVLDEDFRPGGRGRVTDFATSATDDSLRVHARYRPYFEEGACFDPGLVQMMALTAAGGSVTRRRREIVADRQWYEGGLFSEFIRSLHLDDAVFSCHALPQRGHVRGIAARRAARDREFTAEERNLVHLCSLELEAFIGPTALPVEVDQAGLSNRERDTLALLLQGLSEKQVARQLGLSPHTVHVYVKSLYQAFGVHSRAELLARFVGKRRRRSTRV
jgi:DNA-binding CsgD family transcriptional regulator